MQASPYSDIWMSNSKDPLQWHERTITKVRARNINEVLQQVLCILFEYKPKF